MVLPSTGRIAAVFARYSSTATSSFYDAVIVGGGMVGNAMACSMGVSSVLNNKKVLLLESADPKPLKKTTIFSNRTSAITPASTEYLKRIGVWVKFVDYRAKRVDRYEVIDSCSKTTINFTHPDPLNSPAAHIVENNVVVAHLLDHIREKCKNVTVKTNVKVMECRIPQSLLEDAKLILNDGTEIETSLVIGADGGKSIVRHAIGAKYTSWEYGQKGVVAVVELENAGENNIAWQRFLPSGPIALLPLSKNTSNLIWTTSDAHAEELLALRPQEFVDLLNHFLFTNVNQSRITNKALDVVDNFLNSIFRTEKTEIPVTPRIVGLQTDNRAAFPLVFGHSHSYVSTRAALIGDAAHRIHPLGGLGVNLGWNDVATLTGCLEKCLKEGADLGSLTYLSEYDTKSQRHNIPQQVACDWINRLYRTRFPPAIFMRSLGLYAVNRMTPIKRLISAQMSAVN